MTVADKFRFALIAALAIAPMIAFADDSTASADEAVDRSPAAYYRRPSRVRSSKDLSAHFARIGGGSRNADRKERAVLFDRIGLYHLSLSERLHFVQVDGHASGEFEKAGVTALALGSFDELSNVAGTFRRRGDSIGSFPVSVRFAMAGFYMSTGFVSHALEWLPAPSSIMQIPVGPARVSAALIESGLLRSQNKLGAAFDALGGAFEQGNSEANSLLLLQRSRLAYDDRHYTEALDELVKLPRSAPSWYPGLLVGAWSAYHVRDYNLALGSLMTIESPYLMTKFNPEAYILEAATLYRLCYFESAAQSIAKLRSRYGKLLPSLDRFRSQNANRFTLVSSLLNYARGSQADSMGLPENHYEMIMDGLLGSEVLAQMDRSLLEIKQEESVMNELFENYPNNQFNRQLRASFHERLERARREHYRVALKAVTRRLASMRRDLSDALESSLAIEVEINTRIRDRLITGKAGRRKDVDYEAEIKKGYEFWPFQGEFWRDEVGSYTFATSDVCGEQGS